MSAITSIDDLIAAMQTIVHEHEHPEDRAERTAELLAANIKDSTWIPDAYRECEKDGYQARRLHIDPDGAFSICVMAWLPGQQTAIHDHVAWCVVSVCCGEEHEERFSFDSAGQCLQLQGTMTLRPGQTVIHWPVEGDIHRVTCSGDSPAVSIHIYGADISVSGSSIRDCFDSLPIVGQIGSGTRIPMFSEEFR